MSGRILLFAICLAGAALAHKPSDSYLTLDARTMSGSWDIALRDLDDAIALDDDGNGAITWGELRRHEQPLAAYALSRLVVHSDGAPCALRPTGLLVDQHSDGAYAVLTFVMNCAAPRRTLSVQYSLLFDLDPTHRGLLRVLSRTDAQNAVLAPDHATVELRVAPPGILRFAGAGAQALLRSGGLLLLLLGLLLPPSLRRRPLREQLETVLALYLSQSIMLLLIALGAVPPPAGLALAALYLTLAIAAVTAGLPLVRKRPWTVAYVFGLASGASLSSRFAALALSGASRALALLGFQLGLLLCLASVAISLSAPFAFRRARDIAAVDRSRTLP